MTHPAIVDASKLHYAKSRTGSGCPLYNVLPGYSGELYVDTDSGIGYVADGTTKANWRMVVESTRRLRAYSVDPARSGSYTGTIAGSQCVWPGLGGVNWSSVTGTVQVTSHASGDEPPDVASGASFSSLVVLPSASASAVGDLYAAIPAAFTGWDSGGISLKLRGDLSGGSTQSRVTLRIYDPSAGTAVGSASGTVTTTGTAYSTISVTGTTLGSSFTAGDLLHIEITVAELSGAGSALLYLSTLTAAWN